MKDTPTHAQLRTLSPPAPRCGHGPIITLTETACTSAHPQCHRRNTSLNTGLGGVKQLKVGYWHGGCANHLYGGWNMYCLNRVAVDQALP